SEPIPRAWLRLARDAGLATARTTEFASVVLVGERTRLVAVKAVTAEYPLRGRLLVRDAHAAPERAATGTPRPGTVWVEPRLLSLLDLAVGDTLRLGRARLRIARLLTLEPDRGGLLFSLAPRVMMNPADLPATDLIHPASRVRYELLLAGGDAALARVGAEIRARAGADVEIRSPADARPGVIEAIDRARRFLGLAAQLTVIVAGVAVLLTVRHYAAHQLTAVAVMRCLGATQRRMAGLLACKLAWLALIAGALGAAAGFALHALMLSFVAELFARELPPPGLRPLAVGWLTAAAALGGFALPTLLRLRRVTPMRVLRGDLGGNVLHGQLPLVAALAVILALMFWQAGDVRLVLYVFGALTGTVAVLALAAWGLVWLAQCWYRRSGRAHLLWLSGLTRRPWTAVVQMVAIGCGLMALFLLVVVRQDLLAAWRNTIPPDAPNHFLVNIQPQEVAGVRGLLAERVGVEPVFYPMVRGRLTARNGTELSAESYEDPEARHFLRRVFNLSWASELQQGNRIVAGHWQRGEAPAW
ncbi:MAG: FtsX-like permease family protein, partial [Nitrococcus sp.]|nr:FtsX-like permease family protein [Nitrococcus sp.]